MPDRPDGVLAQRGRTLRAGAQMHDAVACAIVAVEPTWTQREPQRAVAAFENPGDRAVTNTVRAFRIMPVMAELLATCAQLVESGIDGTYPQRSTAILPQRKYIVAGETVGVGAIVAIGDEFRFAIRQALQPATGRRDPPAVARTRDPLDHVQR